MRNPDNDEKKEIEKKIERLDGIELSAYLSSKKNVVLTPLLLGKAFEKIAKPVDGFSKAIGIDFLSDIHPSFRTNNGGAWCRSDQGYLGKKYIIDRQHTSGMISSVKLDGFNGNKVEKFRGIKKSIAEELSKQRCVILDISQNIEIDHKDGKYTNWKNISDETQEKSDFQPLCKTANIAKRQHCKKCKETGKRYNAMALGYKEGFILGTEDSQTCVGCYWHDPAYFNKTISKDFVKDDENKTIGW